MLCESRDDVVEEGVNIWAGEETSQFKPKYDIFIIHGLGSHPYHAFLSPPVRRRPSRSKSGIFLTDSVITIRPSSSDLSKASSPSRDELPYSPLATPLDSPWANEYSQTDLLGRIGTFWVRDLLPNDVTDARICTVGYRSQWTSSKFQTNLQECGESLLTALDHARESRHAQSRPIVFIAHSYGGLVVLSALLSAKLVDRYSSISRSVLGCIFLGTPFGGCEYAGFLSAALSMGGNKQEILYDLRPGSRELENLASSFVREYGMLPLVSFYERYNSDVVRSVMVPKEMTLLGDAKSIGLCKDHSDLVKFASSTDDAYKRLITELKSMLKDARHRTARQTAHPKEPRVLRRSHPIPPRSTSRQQVAMELDSREVNVLPGRRAEPLLNLRGGSQEQPMPVNTTTVRRNRYPRSVVQSKSYVARSAGTPSTGDPPGNVLHQLGTHDRNLRSPQNQKEIDQRYDDVLDADHTIKLPSHLQQSYKIMQAKTGAQEVPGNSKTFYSQTPLRSWPIDGEAVEGSRTSEPFDHLSDCSPGDTHEPPSTFPESSVLQPNHAPPSIFPEALAIGSKSQNAVTTGIQHYPSCRPSPRRSEYPIRHLATIERALGSLHETSVVDSRPEIGASLLSHSSTVLPANRIAITGALGAGKTFLAMAWVKMLLTQPELSIFWVRAESEATLAHELGAIASLLRLDRENDEDPWSCLSACVTHLSSGSYGRFLIVLDDLGCTPPSTVDVARLFTTRNNAHLLVTTRTRSLAQRTADESNTVFLGPFHAIYSANVLSRNAAIPDSPVYDQLAQRLENDAFVVYRVRNYLQSTEMSVIDYVTNLEYVMDHNNWTPSSRLANRDLRGEASATSAVLDSCINPGWTRLFDILAEQEPSAAEMLSKLSVLGESTIPLCILTSKASDTAATNVLLDKFFLTRERNYLHASQLMLVAHRSWLLGHGGLASSYKMALAMIANDYPDAAVRAERRGAWEWEPFADAATSSAARSWFNGDETCTWNGSMLDKKRHKLYRFFGEQTQGDQ